MDSLVQWLEAHNQQLVESAVTQLAQSDDLRQTVYESTEAFFDSLLRSIRTSSPLPLNLILLDWIEARSAPTDEDLAALLPILHSLKKVAWELLCETTTGDQLIQWLSELDTIFSSATMYLFRLEAESLLKDTRDELNRALADVGRLNKSKSDFIAVAAHELKTPLTLIEGYNNMLRAEFPDEERPQVGLMLTGIDSGTKRLREIIQDMIDVSLIEMDLFKLHFQPTWLHRLVDILHFDFGEKAKDRTLHFEIRYETIPTKPTYGDPERLYQALQKVVTNAMKYTPDGGSITIRARELPGFTDLVVEDTGIGIAAEDLQHIFEKFSSLGDVSLHSSGKTKFKGGGPGLGLAIARGILEAHGGTIWAESQGYDEQKLLGSTFHIMIPMRSAPPGDQMAELFDDTGAVHDSMDGQNSRLNVMR